MVVGVGSLQCHVHVPGIDVTVTWSPVVAAGTGQRTGAPANYCCFELGEALCFGSGYACEPGQLTASPLGEFDWLLKKVKNMDPELSGRSDRSDPDPWPRVDIMNSWNLVNTYM